MTHQELDTQLGLRVKSERKITHEILRLICMGERQRTPLALGFKDTYDWLIRGHGYSHPAAGRRVLAAQLLKDVPEIGEKLEQGKMNLSTLCQTQRTLKAQQKVTGHKVTIEEKKMALEKIEGKTTKVAERELNTLFPDAIVIKEKTINKRDGRKTIILELSEEDAKEFERARELLSHAMPQASLGETLGRLAREFNNKRDPLRKSTTRRRAESGTDQRCGKSEALTKRELIKIAGGKCSFVNPRTGVKCESRWQLEVDHVIPKAKGGTDHPSNLRCLCRNHNQFAAEVEFGREFMEERRSRSQSRWQKQGHKTTSSMSKSGLSNSPP